MKSTRRFLIVAAVLVGLAVASVGIAYAITGGQPDGDRHPYVGLVVFDVGGVPAWRCSGTLLSPTVFLTAGHCTDGAVAARVWFESEVTDPKYPYGGGRSVEAAEIHTHPDYWWGPTSDPHDVGVLILKKPVKGRVKPATLPTLGFLDDLEAEGKLRQGSDGAKFVVVGYGLTLSWPPPVFTSELQRQFAESEYQTLLKAWLRMSQNWATDDGGTCYGDSGGPAFWRDPDSGDEILVGITSWGDAVCVATGFNYRVDISDTLEFINSFLDGE